MNDGSQPISGNAFTQRVDGTLTDSAVIGPGATLVENQGRVEHITVTDGGELMIVDHSAASDVTVSQGGVFQINSQADGTTVNDGGEAWINGVDTRDPASGGKAENTIINVGGNLTNRYGIDDNTQVNAGGRLNIGWDNPYEIADTARSDHATINAGGEMVITNGGASTDATVRAGGLLVVKNTLNYEAVTDPRPARAVQGAASTTTVKGTMINIGGIDNNTVVNAGGLLVLRGTQGFIPTGANSADAAIASGGSAVLGQGSLAAGWTVAGTTLALTGSQLTDSVVAGGTYPGAGGAASGNRVDNGGR